MTEQTIVCPNCKTEIKLTGSLAAPLSEVVRKQKDKRINPAAKLERLAGAPQSRASTRPKLRTRTLCQFRFSTHPRRGAIGASLVVKKALSDVTAAAERLARYQDNLLAEAKKSADSAEFAYKNGAVGVMDLLDARRTLRAIQLDAALAQADYAKALAAWQSGLSALQ